VDRYSFDVGLSHSFLHAGLSRRSRTPASTAPTLGATGDGESLDAASVADLMATPPRRRAAGLVAVEVDVRRGGLGSPAATKLVAELNEEIQARYPEPLDGVYLSLESDEVKLGRGSFALAWG
jgi:hypothetical protein